MKKLSLVIMSSLLLFSCKKSSETALPPSAGACEISAYFSPRGGAEDAVVREIESAKREIDVAIFAFTSRPIGDALIKAYRRGVKVRVVMDREQARNEYSRYKALSSEGIPVRFLPLEGQKGLMHNKYAVIDGKVLITGSFNWTGQAEGFNYENLLVLKNCPVVKDYQENFERLWQIAR